MFRSLRPTVREGANHQWRFVRNEIRYFNKDLPIPLREALRRAIHASPIVPDEMKILVAKP
jgi:hypothetical protein